MINPITSSAAIGYENAYSQSYGNHDTAQILKVKTLIESSSNRKCYFDGPLSCNTIQYLTDKGFIVNAAAEENCRYVITW